MKARSRKWLIALGVILLLLVVVFLLRIPIMRGFGHYLICEDKLEPVEAMFVLSGAPMERGDEAATVFKTGIAKQAICTGESIPQDLYALGLIVSESELTRMNMIRGGADSTRVTFIKRGTSTQEESDIILAYCKEHSIKKIILISSKFHTRRVHKVFHDKFEDAGIQVLIHGAKSGSYDEENWWANEYGLIALNNEYVKLLYYAVKY